MFSCHSGVIRHQSVDVLLLDEAAGHVSYVDGFDLLSGESGGGHRFHSRFDTQGPEGLSPEFSEFSASGSYDCYVPHSHSSGILMVFLYFA